MTLLVEILLLAGCTYAVFKAGVHYTIWRIQQDLIALENGELEFEDDEEDVLASSEFMSIVKEGGIFYAYGNQDRFLTQSNDLMQLFKNIKNDFPNTTWLIAQENTTLSEEEQNSIIPILKQIFEGPK
jgi:hypothetical protein